MNAVLMFMFNRIARNMRLHFGMVEQFGDAGVELISITEDFCRDAESVLAERSRR